MAGKPPGSIVSIGYRLTADECIRYPREGDTLVTRTGRRYLVVEAKPSRSARSGRLKCLVLGEDDVVKGGWEYTLGWNSRKRKAKR